MSFITNHMTLSFIILRNLIWFCHSQWNNEWHLSSIRDFGVVFMELWRQMVFIIALWITNVIYNYIVKQNFSNYIKQIWRNSIAKNAINWLLQCKRKLTIYLELTLSVQNFLVAKFVNTAPIWRAWFVARDCEWLRLTLRLRLRCLLEEAHSSNLIPDL